MWAQFITSGRKNKKFHSTQDFFSPFWEVSRSKICFFWLEENNREILFISWTQVFLAWRIWKTCMSSFWTITSGKIWQLVYEHNWQGETVVERRLFALSYNAPGACRTIMWPTDTCTWAYAQEFTVHQVYTIVVFQKRAIRF